MKFYNRYPGDINIKTGHLDPAEMGCYDRLLDHYYSTEAPIPLERAHNICRATKPEHQHACDTVLAEFFERTPQGWVQKRTEEEIASAQRRIQAARENGKKGGRPTQQKPNGLPPGTQSGTQEPTQQKAIQKPESSSSKKKRVAAAPRPSVPVDILVETGFDPKTAADFIEHKASLKAPLTERAWKDHLRECTKAGWTPLQAAEKVMAKSWKGFEAKYVATEVPPPARRAPDVQSVGGAPGAEATARMLAEQALVPLASPQAVRNALARLPAELRSKVRTAA